MAAIACAAVVAPVSATPASAAPTSAATATAAAPAPKLASAVNGAGDVSAKPAVSKAAWSAGRNRFGARATADQAIAAYWTAARMRAATPVEEAPFLAAAGDRYAQTTGQRAKKARVDAARGIRPAKARPEFRMKPHAGAVAAPAATGGSVLAAYNPGLSYWHPTARTNGKVFFSMGGGNFVCSGAVVNSEGRDTVWTAGHCVHGGRGGAWATNWQFVPSYDDDLFNPRPYGTWTASNLWSRTAWTNNSDFAEDIGVAIMGTRNGWHIVDYLGGHGFRANAGKNVYEYAFGYPSEWPFDGGNLMRCQGSSSPEWQVLFWSAETIKIPCDMTRGSSGGPWLNGYDGNYGYLNGVNSRIDRIVGPTIMLSPYFDDTALSLFNSTRHL